ncbi:MAG: hypothetical protein QNJ82_00535 [Gammaproteobacteria bacterium]|nr:hypothetical protein [Gammaproteobacteria bacterium]
MCSIATRLTAMEAVFYLDHGAEVVVADNAFTENSAANGAGVSVLRFGELALERNTFLDNAATRRSGTFGGEGAYAVFGDRVGAKDNTLTANAATSHERGAWFQNIGVSLSVTGNVFSRNSTQTQDGGGLWAKLVVDGATVTVMENKFDSNEAGPAGEGGGLWIRSARIRLENNRLFRNSAEKGGGAAFSRFVELVAVNNAFAGNIANTDIAEQGGGGTYLEPGRGSSSTLTNNSYAENSAALGAGGGLWLYLPDPGARASFFNNLILQNRAPVAGDIWIENDADGDLVPSPVEFFANNFDQSPDGFVIGAPIPIDTSSLNNVDPLFVDAAGGDLHLQIWPIASPVIDLKLSDAPLLPPDDMDGEQRVGSVDMGADEATDGDSDGMADYQDNCIAKPNGPSRPDAGGNIQLDTDGDCFGNICDADINNNGFCDAQDFAQVKLGFDRFSSDPDSDFNGNGFVDAFDFALMKTCFDRFGSLGPSGTCTTTNSG